MNGSFDHKFILRIKHLVAKQLGDDFKAAFFNVHRLDILNHFDASPLGKYYRS